MKHDNPCNTSLLCPRSELRPSILVLWDQKVILDADLAELYGVSTKAFNQAVKRNQDRFPEDFLFRLPPEEKAEVVTNCDHLGRMKYSHVLPSAFTEHGAIMAANVLNTPRAITIRVSVVRAFVKLSGLVNTQKEFGRKLGGSLKKTWGERREV